MPPVRLEAPYIITRDSSRVMFVAATATGSLSLVRPEGRTPLDVDRLAAHVTGGGVLLVDNTRTVTRLAGMLPAPLGLWVRFAASQPGSRVPVATVGLREKLDWQPPSGAGRLRNWVEFTGGSVDNPWPVAEVLLDGTLTGPQVKFADRIRRCTDSMMESVQYGTGPGVTNQVYQKLVTAQQCWEALLATDPVRVVERCTTGESCQVTVTSVTPARVTVTLGGVLRSKIGDVMLFDGHDSPGFARLDSITVSGGVLGGVLTAPSKKVRGFTALHDGGVGLQWFISDPPFDATPRGRFSWWSSYFPSRVPAVSRHVPEDIVAAAEGKTA